MLLTLHSASSPCSLSLHTSLPPNSRFFYCFAQCPIPAEYNIPSWTGEEKLMKNAEAQFFLFQKPKQNVAILEIFYYISQHWLFLQNTTFNIECGSVMRLHKHFIKSNMHFETLKASYIATCLCLSQHPKLV